MSLLDGLCRSAPNPAFISTNNGGAYIAMALHGELQTDALFLNLLRMCCIVLLGSFIDA